MSFFVVIGTQISKPPAFLVANQLSYKEVELSQSQGTLPTHIIEGIIATNCGRVDFISEGQAVTRILNIATNTLFLQHSSLEKIICQWFRKPSVTPESAFLIINVWGEVQLKGHVCQRKSMTPLPPPAQKKETF